VRWKINELGMVGLRLSGACAAHFWIGWLAWLIAGWAVLYAEYNLRAANQVAGYVIEAMGAMLVPFFALALADHTSLTAYQRVWFDLQRPGWAPQMLDISAAERIREDLRFNPLLRWFRPPLSKLIGAQVMTITLWYTAVALHPSRGFWARYGEWVTDVLGGYTLLACTATAALFWLNGAGEALPWLLYVIILGAGTALGVLGYSVIRFSSRRQAVLDYFRNWRIDTCQTQQDPPAI
jgi:hypothetical protein